ncbi:MAG TPA: hypothetical protein VMA30_06310 [Xanthobacteraceae bacterium]|nr:hypothetical protein [Xanthobacteraceae bacterium]
MRSQAIAAILAGLTVLVGGEYVRAASHGFGVDGFGADVTGTITATAAIGPAELDPVFQQKLLERVRGRYERAHTLGVPESRQGQI